jgi:hypothetical protein
MLLSNLKVPMLQASLSTLAPSLSRVSFVAFLVVRGVFGSQSTPFILDDDIVWLMCLMDSVFLNLRILLGLRPLSKILPKILTMEVFQFCGHLMMMQMTKVRSVSGRLTGPIL